MHTYKIFDPPNIFIMVWNIIILLQYYSSTSSFLFLVKREKFNKLYIVLCTTSKMHGKLVTWIFGLYIRYFINTWIYIYCYLTLNQQERKEKSCEDILSIIWENVSLSRDKVMKIQQRSFTFLLTVTTIFSFTFRISFVFLWNTALIYSLLYCCLLVFAYCSLLYYYYIRQEQEREKKVERKEVRRSILYNICLVFCSLRLTCRNHIISWFIANKQNNNNNAGIIYPSLYQLSPLAYPGT